MCRGCMRRSHRADPFHRIEKWNGEFFRPAEQWEVGTCLVVPHRNRKLSCDGIKTQEDFLSNIEERNDAAEQNHIGRNASATPFSKSSSFANNNNSQNEDIEMSNETELADDGDDEPFMSYLQELRDRETRRDDDDEKFLREEDVEDDMEDDETDVTMEYTAQRLVGTYVRVVHTNGIHNIAMITCTCEGHDDLPSDLLAARLLPTSFVKIRTIFSAQLLDYFRLSNLETKASAFHFYHLLQRLTNPMEPSQVLNLYREFRRMSRIWRWMKKLKWAGYCNDDSPANKVGAGDLAVFCPACPQPGINIPDDWKEDKARLAITNFGLYLLTNLFQMGIQARLCSRW